MDLTGRQLGPYQITHEIGRGGMSTIYLTVDTRTQQEVALKVLLPHLVHDPVTLRRFQQEGENAKRLIHPNIVRVFEAGASDGYHYIAMEYAARGTVATLLKERTHPMSAQEAIPLLRRVAAALDYAHHRGILHRDIKPSNVLIGSGGQILLSDFGVARHMATDQTVVTLAGYSVGTPAYMSPEQARGDYDLDQRSDIYSLGVVAYAMLTHALPFDAESQLVLLRKIIDEAPTPPEQVNAALPPGVIYSLQRVLAKTPQQRYATAGEFVDALERGLTWQPTPKDWAALTQSVAPKAQPNVRHATAGGDAFTLTPQPPTRRRTSALFFGLGSLIVILAALVLLRPRGSTASFFGLFNDSLPTATAIAEAAVALPTSTATASPTATPEPTLPPPTLVPTPINLLMTTEAELHIALAVPAGWVRTERNGAIYFEAPNHLAWLFIDHITQAQSSSAEALLTAYLARQDSLFRTTTLLAEQERPISAGLGYEQYYETTLIGGAQAVTRLFGFIDGERAFILGLSSEPAQKEALDQLYITLLESLELLAEPTPTASATTMLTLTSTPSATATPSITPTLVAAAPSATTAATATTTATTTAVPTRTATVVAPSATATATKAPTSPPQPTTTPTPTVDANATANAQKRLVATSVAQTLTALPTATPRPSATPTPPPSATATRQATNTATPPPTSTATATPDLLLTLTAIDRQLTALAPFLTTAATPSPTAPLLTPTSSAANATTPVATSAPKAPTQSAQANLITGFENFGSWRRGDEPYGTLLQSQAQVAEGVFAAELKYTFPATAGNRNYVVFQAASPLRITETPAALQMAVYGDGASHYLNIWVGDAANHTWQFTFGQIRHVGWATLTAPLALDQPWPVGAISGEPVTQLTPPLVVKAIVLDGVPDGADSSGVIYLDALQSSTDGSVVIPPTAAPTTPGAATAPTEPQAPPAEPDADQAPPITTAALQGRIAYSLFNGQTMDVLVYNLADGNRWRLANKRQPDFSRGGILLVNGEGGGVNDIVRITQNGEEGVTSHPEDSHPQWSKSSQSVVFASTHQGDGKSRIYWQRDASGRFDTPPMAYSGRELFGKYPVYLDNWRIAYQGCNFWAGGSACGIYTVDTNGGQPGRATDQTADIPTDSLGDRILFTSNRDGNWDIYVVNTDGGGFTRLTDHPGRDGLATAAPDFQHIAFVSDREGSWAVYVMNIDGSNQQKLFDLNGGYGGGSYEWYEERLSWGP